MPAGILYKKSDQTLTDQCMARQNHYYFRGESIKFRWGGVGVGGPNNFEGLCHQRILQRAVRTSLEGVRTSISKETYV